MILRCRPAIIPTLFLATWCLVVVRGSAVVAQVPQVAADANQPFAQFVRTRWVLLDEENGLNGAIGTFDAASGSLNPTNAIRLDLYNANADLVHQVTTGPDGQFRIPDMAGGLYQGIAQSSSGVLAFSLFAIERGQPTGRTETRGSTILVQAPRQTEDRLDIFSAAVPPTFTQLNAILRLYYGRTTPAYVGQFGASAPIASGDRSDLRAKFPPEDGERQTAAIASAIRAHDVLLRDGNRMVGRLYTMDADSGLPRRVRQAYVHLIRDDQPVGPPISVNEDGVFEAELSDGPGAYSIVVAGSGGFGACSFYARRVGDVNAASPVSVRWASMRLAQRGPQADLIPPPANAPQNAASPFQFTMSLINDPRVWQQAFPAAAADPISAAVVAPPAGGFGGGPASYGGGGASGASGGLGRALLGGALAAGITALAVDGDGDPQQLISPFVP